MLTVQECLDLCDLTDDEIDAIATHEHLTQLAAAAYGQYLISSPDGVPRLKRIILDDIADAERRHDAGRVLSLKLVLKTFVENHPDAKPR